jgi:hypothetical protein
VIHSDGIAAARTLIAPDASTKALQRRLPDGWELAPYPGDALRQGVQRRQHPRAGARSVRDREPRRAGDRFTASQLCRVHFASAQPLVHGGPLWEALCYAQIGGLTLATAVTFFLVPVFYTVIVFDLKVVAWQHPRNNQPATA